MPEVSIIIPTLGRSEALRDCLESLWNQSFQDFEIIKVTEEGPLARLRNEGARKAQGNILIFIDDDVACERGWLESIVYTFSTRSIGGCSGPAVITSSYRKRRDIFKWPIASFIHDLLFLGQRKNLPGHITKSGAWTSGATVQGCSYQGEVQFLEACNMAFTAEAFWRVGGFDEAYKGIGDWSEPDLCFRLRKLGVKLWFSRDARLEHRPSISGAFKKRGKQSAIRLANYELFSSRWVRPCWQHSLYKWFLRTYYKLKEKCD